MLEAAFGKALSYLTLTKTVSDQAVSMARTEGAPRLSWHVLDYFIGASEMHVYFRRLGQSQYLNVTVEDRTDSLEFPRTYLTTSKPFKGLAALLEAAEHASVNEHGLADLLVFAQSTSHLSDGPLYEVALSSEEVSRMGFNPMVRKSREFRVSIVPNASNAQSVTLSAKMLDVPPGEYPPGQQKRFSIQELRETLKMIDRNISDLWDPRLGPMLPQKSKFDAEDLDTLWASGS